MRRFLLVLGLSVAGVATTYADDLLTWLFQHHLDHSVYNRVLALALTETVVCAVWLLPLLFFPKLRDLGSFPGRGTWTVLLVVPSIALNLVFFGRYPGIPWQPAVCLVWYGMGIGVFEELIFRGYAFRNSPELRPRLVVLTSAACFMTAHFANLGHQTLWMVLQSLPFVFALGVGFGIIRIVSGSLLWCMLLHGALDSVHQFTKSGPAVDKWLPLTWGVMGVGVILTLCLHPKFRTPPSSGPPSGNGPD